MRWEPIATLTDDGIAVEIQFTRGPGGKPWYRFQTGNQPYENDTQIMRNIPLRNLSHDAGKFEFDDTIEALRDLLEQVQDRVREHFDNHYERLAARDTPADRTNKRPIMRKGKTQRDKEKKSHARNV